MATQTPMATMERSTLEEVAQLAADVRGEVQKAFYGGPEPIELILTTLMARGHVLLEGVPGIAKTTLVKAFAAALGCSFRRIQFTPDLLPSDITGTYVLQAGTFALREGPIFAQVILADEVNRAPAKTQSALLEAMQERQVTIEGQTRVLEPPFFVLATQNPIEHEGTYPLPEAQVDRFLAKLKMGYPSAGDEKEMLRRYASSDTALQTQARARAGDHPAPAGARRRGARRGRAARLRDRAGCSSRARTVASRSARRRARRCSWCTRPRRARCSAGAISCCRTT